MGAARKYDPSWDADIAESVRRYNSWYRAEAPMIYAEARSVSSEWVEAAFEITGDFVKLSPEALEARPEILLVARQALAPPLARDRLVTLAGVPKNLVKVMEEGNRFPHRVQGLNEHLEKICEVLNSLIDPVTLYWVRDGAAPSEIERDRAIAVLGDRLARAIADPRIRNRQEQRMRETMEAFLASRGYVPTAQPTFEMPPGSYVVSRNMPVNKADGTTVGQQIDVVIKPKDPARPLIACEQKSAGDFTNVNKRRKEEAAKADALRRTYGDKVAFLLHLSGYFDAGYLSYEQDHQIAWVWDHRLEDLDSYI